MYNYMKVSVVRKSRKAGGSVEQTSNPVCTLNVTDSFEKSRGSSRVCICTHTFVLGHRTTWLVAEQALWSTHVDVDVDVDVDVYEGHFLLCIAPLHC